MSKFHITSSQWGLISGIRQMHSDLIVVQAPRSPFVAEARKGQLTLVVEAAGDVSRGRQACAVVAKTISDTFYADGSLSITASLRAALKAANASLYEYNFSAPPHKRTLVGVTCAVVHGTDLFVTQAPPAQAFIAHTTKLRSLPVPPSWTNGVDAAAPNWQGSLGTSLGSEPEFFRSVIQPGDTVVLCSSNLARLLSKQQAEQLICFSDAATIAEELYSLCRAASLPEAHAIALEAVPGPAPATEAPPQPPKRERRSSWFSLSGRPSTGEATASSAPLTPNPAPVAMPGTPSPAALVAPTSEPQGMVETLPVADVVPLPPSAFLGEGDYGGTVRPPAVPRRNRQIDLSDNHGTPVDFAALPRKTPPPPPTVAERLTMPLRAVLAVLLGGLANAPRRTRTMPRQPAEGLRLKGLSYKKQRPPLPWFNIFLIVGVVVLLIVVGMQQNRKRDTDTVSVALNKVDAAVTAARRADSDNAARQQLTAAEAALNDDVQKLVQSGLITETKPIVWSRYLQVRTRYDQAMAAINRIGFVNELEPVATLPGREGLVTRIVLGTAVVSDTQPPLYYLESSGSLYELGRAEPILASGQDVAGFVTKPIRRILWREVSNSLVALDRGDPINPMYTAYLRDGENWLANQLQQTELMEPAEGDLPMATFGGNLYIWDRKTQQLWKYANGFYADVPTEWITKRGSASYDQVVDVQVDGRVYLLNRDASVSVFEGGQVVQQFAAPQLPDPVSTVARFVVTPDVLAEDGVTVAQPGYIYILDTGNERVLQLSKTDGSLVQQIRARSLGPLNQMSDLAVDEAQRQVYIANGAQVLQTLLPDPPQFTPDEATTATPEP